MKSIHFALSLGFLSLLSLTPSFASIPGHEIKMDVHMDGKLVSSPRLIVKSGEMATISQKNKVDENFVEVETNDENVNDKKLISMKFTLGRINENGERIILARPHILAQENESVEITVAEKGNPEKLSLSVTATRKDIQ